MPPKQLPPIDLTPRRPTLGNLPSRTGSGPSDEEIDAAARTAGAAWGASQQAAPAVASPPPAPARTARLGLIIPGYLDDQLRERGHRERKSMTALVMEALHQAGYQIEAADLAPDKRRKS